MVIRSHFSSIIICISLLLTYACTKERTDLERKLISNKWVYYPYGKIKKNLTSITYRKFLEDGTCEDFYLSSNDPFIGLLCSKKEDILWYYDDEKNKLNIASYDFKIIAIEEDTIHLHRLDTASKAMLIRYHGQKIN
jgi:hypothetical protein